MNKAVSNNISHESASFSEDILQSASEERYIDPRLIEQNRRINRFQASQQVTHIVLHITPTAVALDNIIPPAEFTYDLHSIKLLFPHQPVVDINELLSEGNKVELKKLGKKLANLIRLEYTAEGVKYSMIGALSEPVLTSFPWPGDEVVIMSDSEEEEEHDQEDVEVQLEVEVAEEEEEEKVIEEPVIDKLEEEDELIEESEDLEEVVVIEAKEEELPPPPTTTNTSTPPSSTDRDWKCPFHSDSTAPPSSTTEASTETTTEATTSHCQCIRREVTLKGSDLWIYANILHPTTPTPLNTIETTDTLNNNNNNTAYIPISSDINLSTCCHQLPGISVIQCSNTIILYAVDKIDDHLHCEVTLTPLWINNLLLIAKNEYYTDVDINTTTADVNATTTTITYPVSSLGVVTIDLTKHQRLFNEILSYLFQSTYVDLFLSRKTKLMKLIIK